MKGRSAEYPVFFAWLRSLEVFHLACDFELAVPEARGVELQELITSINEVLWLAFRFMDIR